MNEPGQPSPQAEKPPFDIVLTDATEFVWEGCITNLNLILSGLPAPAPRPQEPSSTPNEDTE